MAQKSVSVLKTFLDSVVEATARYRRALTISLNGLEVIQKVVGGLYSI